MIPFIGLGTYVRALFLTILFVEVCVSSCLTIWSFMQKNLLPKIISPVSAISALLFILPYSAYIFAENNGVSVNGYSFVEKLLGLPAFAVILFAAIDAIIISALLIFSLWESVTEYLLFLLRKVLISLKLEYAFHMKTE